MSTRGTASEAAAPEERADGVWNARGLLFENCNCTTVCPGHVHFSQPCTHEVCHGFWAVRFREGRLGPVPVAGLDVVITYESPQVMIEGGWRERLLVTDRADAKQVRALESLFRGELGGPWEILARFVGEWLPTRTVPIEIEEAPTRKGVRIPGILEAAVEALRGRDRSRPVTFENIYNQIHDARQVLARGTTDYDDRTVRIRTEGTHGLWSDFAWSG